MLGSPIAHSKSPQLHLAAYRALGLDDWTYERIECTAEELPGVVGGFGPEWVGVSVTMPGKFAALRFADERTDRAELVGSANTLVRTPTRLAGRQHRHRRGGRARSGAASWTSAGRVDRAAPRRRRSSAWPNSASPRSPSWRATRTRRPGWSTWDRDRRRRPGSAAWTATSWPTSVAAADVLVSTIPADVAAAVRRHLRRVPVLLDAIYDPWPTPLAAAVAAAGGRVISGLQMLLHQAFAQVEQFTGLPAPREAMTCALEALPI